MGNMNSEPINTNDNKENASQWSVIDNGEAKADVEPATEAAKLVGQAAIDFAQANAAKDIQESKPVASVPLPHYDKQAEAKQRTIRYDGQYYNLEEFKSLDKTA